MAREQLKSYENDIATGNPASDVDPDWHVPSTLNEEASLLGVEFQRFLKNKDVWRRTRDERKRLERNRIYYFHLVFEHLVEKYDMARQTQALFQEVEEGRKGFVLFLRGFAYRAHYHTGVTITHAEGSDLDEKPERLRLARALAPVPLIWIANPVESGPLDAVMEEEIYGVDAKEESSGFRVEMGSGWETDIRELISAASFIIVYNQSMNEGVVREIKFIEELGRRNDAFFHAPEQAAATLGLGIEACSPITDAAVKQMQTSTTGNPLGMGALPKPICLWIDGPRRERLEFETTTLCSWLDSLKDTVMPIALDLRLDAGMAMLAQSLLLERLDLVPPILLTLSDTLRTFGEEYLEEGEILAEKYACFAKNIRHALARYPAGPPVVERTMSVLQDLRNSWSSEVGDCKDDDLECGIGELFAIGSRLKIKINAVPSFADLPCQGRLADLPWAEQCDCRKIGQPVEDYLSYVARNHPCIYGMHIHNCKDENENSLASRRGKRDRGGLIKKVAPEIMFCRFMQ